MSIRLTKQIVWVDRSTVKSDPSRNQVQPLKKHGIEPDRPTDPGSRTGLQRVNWSAQQPIFEAKTVDKYGFQSLSTGAERADAMIHWLELDGGGGGN